MHQATDHQPGTVIISLILNPNCEVAYQAWQDRVNRVVASYPGLLAQEILPPILDIQPEWVVIFRFDSMTHLNQWLDSQERQELLTQGASLFLTPPRQQILTTGERPGRSVSVIFSHRIKPGSESKFMDWHQKILRAHRSFPGALDLESFPPGSGVQSEWVDIARFGSAESLSHWLNSPKRLRLLKELKPLVDSWDVRQLNSNFAGWFPSQDSYTQSPPPAWKQAFSVLLALYPVVMLINFYISPHLPAWPLPVNMLVSNILSICILNWLGMPLVNRWLDFWLQPSKPSPRLDRVGTVGIAAALLVMVVMFQQLS